MLTKLLADLYIISLLDDEPNDVGGMSSAELKAKFDEAANTIKTYINETLIPELAGVNGAGSVGINTVPGLTGVSTVQAALAKIEEQMAEMTQGAVADESITTAKLAALAVTSAKLAAAAVETDKIKDGAVTSVKLADLAVTAARLADFAVETAKIKDKAVTTKKIADKAVTTAQLGDASVGTAQLDALSVTAAKLAALSIETAKIKDKAVTGAKIADKTVTRAKLTNDALISPVKWVAASPYTVIADDLEKTIVFDAALATVQINMSNELIAALPAGASFAFMQWSSANSTKLTITAGSDYYIGKAGEKSGTKGGSVATSSPRVMVVAKKMTTSSVMIFGVTD